jgi:CO/xanthine dehydrogenase Mo-binding subunit
MQDSGTAILHASAQAREILVGLAATRFGVAANQLKTREGTVVAPDGRHLPYGDLVKDNVLHVEAQPPSATKLKQPQDFRTMGQSLPRVDIPAKVTGLPAYVQDMRLEGMVHARVVRPRRAERDLPWAMGGARAWPAPAAHLAQIVAQLLLDAWFSVVSLPAHLMPPCDIG